MRILSAHDRRARLCCLGSTRQRAIPTAADGGATTAITDSEGLATIVLHGASGYGRVALCADGVLLCELQVRSPDVVKSAQAKSCVLGTAFSAVNGSDIVHPLCGFLVNFGAVTAGVNDGYDFDCSGSVNGNDVLGGLFDTGMIRFFGDTGTLGARNECANP